MPNVCKVTLHMASVVVLYPPLDTAVIPVEIVLLFVPVLRMRCHISVEFADITPPFIRLNDIPPLIDAVGFVILHNYEIRIVCSDGVNPVFGELL